MAKRMAVQLPSGKWVNPSFLPTPSSSSSEGGGSSAVSPPPQIPSGSTLVTEQQAREQGGLQPGQSMIVDTRSPTEVRRASLEQQFSQISKGYNAEYGGFITEEGKLYPTSNPNFVPKGYTPEGTNVGLTSVMKPPYSARMVKNRPAGRRIMRT